MGDVTGVVATLTDVSGNDRTPLLVQLETPWLDAGSPTRAKRVRGVRVVGERIGLSGTGALFLTTEVEDDRLRESVTYQAFQNGRWLDRTTPGWLKGRRWRHRLSGVVKPNFNLANQTVTVEYVPGAVDSRDIRLAIEDFG